MKSASATTATIVLFAAIVLQGVLGAATAQPSPHAGDIPQSLRVEHNDTLAQLTVLSRRPGAVGIEARKALILFQRHLQREEAFVLPPLTLLPLLADGKVSPDMKWAVAMADRVKAERDEIFLEHTEITEAMNALAAAARKAHDAEALNFAQAAVADSLNDIELVEPMTLLIGDYLRSKLPPGP